MTDLTKPDTTTEEPAAPGDDTPETKTKKTSEPLVPGSKSWFWSMRLMHIPLFVAPALPLITLIEQVKNPTLESDKLADKVGHGTLPDGVEVSRVVVEITQASILDRVILAIPSLVFAIALFAVCRAIWRIEINLAANRRPFTDKDEQWLRRGMLLAGISWAVGFVVNLGYPFWLEHEYGVLGTVQGFDAMSIVTIALLITLGCFASVYKKAHTHYKELEQAV